MPSCADIVCPSQPIHGVCIQTNHYSAGISWPLPLLPLNQNSFREYGQAFLSRGCALIPNVNKTRNY